MSEVTVEVVLEVVASNDENLHLFHVENVSDEYVPKVGMTFDTKEDAYDFWSKYGFLGGFGVMRKCGHNKGSLAVDRTFRCSKEGTSKKTDNPLGRQRFGVKTNCQVKMVVKFVAYNSQWIVSDVYLAHNHKLLPDMVHYMLSHNKIPLNLKKQIEINDDAGLPLACNVKAVMAQGGGVGRVNFTERKIRNEVYNVRKKKFGEGDAEALVSYFVKRQKDDTNFYFDAKFFDDNSLRHLFWADSRSRLAFAAFGDALTFDATYGTNRYNMKFCPFLGVNQHGSTILFGCGLLENEKVESYVWLFNTWLKCMNNKAPDGIITDQCPSITGAIREVFPNSIHRFCMWHILRKLPEKIKGPNAEAVQCLISETVRYSYTRREFNEEWEEIFNVYEEYKDNEWLQDIYKDRAMWVPAFLSHLFWAGMSTTQRSESMNSFFGKYFTNMTCLRSFAIQYENVIAKLRENEKSDEYGYIDKVVEPFSNLEIEKQYLESYTLNMFFKFQKQVKALANVCCVVKADLGGLIYEVSDESEDENYKFKVFFNRAEKKASCVCRLFEFSGILCRHILCVFKQERIKRVEDCYIMERWTKTKQWPHLENFEEGVANRLSAENYNRLHSQLFDLFSTLVNEGSRNDEVRSMLVNGLAELQSRIKSFLGGARTSTRSNSVLLIDDSDECSTPVVKNPPVASSKGRPPKKGRLRSFRSPVEDTGDTGKKAPPKPKKSVKRKAENGSNVGRKRKSNGKVKNVISPESPSTPKEDDDTFVNEEFSFHQSPNVSFHPARPTWNFDMNKSL